ncbi:uncharacterized protein F4807DRAFT_463639 [Annulohypoxylon truncatum]|uniref:uncharacterized protein n=1 Tax=Annulohypoxylon truncatum TaxID=327061 RepID=UPI002007889E|nr:uncharacterized protein F4807DRAFT_463639 [Annulohypoxylon truncatum]KAI1206428.1 hypothetical protein F4807DRAFT_463639 [Annulohypoxylon truncatum]
MPPEDESAAGSSTSAAAAAAADAAATAVASSESKTKSTHSHSHSHGSDPEARVPFLAWFLVGGTGQPPKEKNFLRMAHERNEAGRKNEEYAAARKQALSERSKYLADWEKQWGPTGGAALLSKVCGSSSQKKK